MSSLPDIAIIGPGKVGVSIGSLAREAGYRIVALGGRDEDKTREAARVIGSGVKTCSPLKAAKFGQIVLLTVRDDAIESVCSDLSRKNAFKQGQVVAHLSGVLSSQSLAPAADLCGAVLASAHPLQMFPTVQEAYASMPGSYWFCEGEPIAVEMIEQLVVKIGGIPRRITAAGKPLYHCASVIACNYLNVLMDLALTVAEDAGLERKATWQALVPIVNATIANIDKFGTADALTGPIARGDVETVKRHLEALDSHQPEIARIYKDLGKWAVRLARQQGTLRKQDEARLRDLL